MGAHSSSFQSNELHYYSTVTDDNYSCNDVYTCTRLPMTYIVKVKLPIGDMEFFNQMSEEKGYSSGVLLKLFKVQLTQECQCRSLASRTLVSYWEYFNYSLEHLLKRRSEVKKQLSQEQLWHIVKVCCEGYLALQQHGILYDFQPNKLTIGPEGKVKMHWSHVTKLNSHINFLNFFDNQCRDLPVSFYSPEEMTDIINRENNHRLDFQKCNIFSFGVLMLYSITLLEPMKHFYVQNKVDTDSMRRNLENQPYNRSILTMVKNCLDAQPSRRPDFKQLESVYQSKFNETGISIHPMKRESSTTAGDRKQSRLSLRKKPL